MKEKFFLIFLFVLISGGIFWNWRQSIFDRSMLPSVDEGFADMTAAQYIRTFLHQEHRLPKIFDTRTYSQSMDTSYYKRTIIAMPLVIMAELFKNNPDRIYVLAYILGIGVVFFLFSLISKQLNLGQLATIIGIIFYVFLSPFLGFGILSGNFRMFIIYIVSISLLYGLLIYFRKELNVSVIGLVLSFFSFYVLFIGNPTSATLAAIILLPLANLLVAGSWKKIFFAKAAIFYFFCLAVGLNFLNQILKVDDIFPSFKVTAGNLVYNEMTNPLNALFSLGWYTFNKIAYPINPILFNIAAVFFLFLVAGGVISFRDRKAKLLLFLMIFIGFCFFTGIYGPLRSVFTMLPSFYRSPTRLFGNTFCLLLEVIAMAGVAYYIRINRRLSFALLIPPFLVVVSGILTLNEYLMRSYRVSPEMLRSVSLIDKRYRVLTLPLHGPSSFNYPLEAGGYVPYAMFGSSLNHVGEYLLTVNNIKNAYLAPSPWEVPWRTANFFNECEALLQQNEIEKMLNLLSWAPDLRYLLIYRSIIPEKILENLELSQKINVLYKSESISLLEIKQNKLAGPIEGLGAAAFLFSPNPLNFMSRRQNNNILLIDQKDFIKEPEYFRKMANSSYIFDNVVLTDVINEIILYRTVVSRGIMEKIISRFDKSYANVGWSVTPALEAIGGYFSDSAISHAKYVVSYRPNQDSEYYIFGRFKLTEGNKNKVRVSVAARIFDTKIEANLDTTKWINLGKVVLSRGSFNKLIVEMLEDRSISLDVLSVIPVDMYHAELSSWEAKFDNKLLTTDNYFNYRFKNYKNLEYFKSQNSESTKTVYSSKRMPSGEREYYLTSKNWRSGRLLETTETLIKDDYVKTRLGQAPSYLLLAKSYLPYWQSRVSRANNFASNYFLNGFYLSEEEVELQYDE